MTTPAPPDTSGILDLLGEIHISLGKMGEKMDREWANRNRLNQNVAPLKVDLIPVTNSNNTQFNAVDQPNQLGPRTGWIWDIHTLIGQGISSGTVSVYENSIFGMEWANFTTSGQFNWGKNQFVLTPGSRLILQSNGSLPAAGAIISIRGLQIAEPYYGDYSV